MFGDWPAYFRFLIKKLFSPPILLLTLAGNALILVFSFIFYLLEVDRNAGIKDLFDAVWWAFSTVTTVGYGDLVPVTSAGRFVSILLMLMGTGLFVAHTALLASVFLDRKILLFFNKKQKQDRAEATHQKTVDSLLQDIKQKVDHLEQFLQEQNKK